MLQPQLEIMRHSAAHLMATAVLELFPEAKFGVGPVVENGFYYDFELPRVLTTLDLLKIEKKMKDLKQRGVGFERQELALDDAVKLFKSLGQKYKVELLQDLKKFGTTKMKDVAELPEIKGAVGKVTVYKTGKFVDLCRGPHVSSTKEINAFKVWKLAGAYWRGDEKNPQLQRVYGLAFETQLELEEYLRLLEEAEKRDHRRLGKELDLFVLSPEVGLGLPLWTPSGTIIRDALQQFLREEQLKRGYLPVTTPHIGSLKLYQISGHWEHYRETMYAPIKIDDEEFLLKPMNCPHHIMIFKSRAWSYRDLPARFCEFGTVYRYEKSGELSGLTRVRGFTQDDAHLFVRPDQIKQEFAAVVDLVLTVFKTLRFKNYRVRLGLRDAKSAKYAGDDKNWTMAEKQIEEVVKEKKLKYSREEGEAAFYGPKLDFVVKDILGRDWQLGTVQLDYNLPERFQLEYTDKGGQKVRPVMIHRAPFGSLERFIGILIEHFAGAFPVWLSPAQVVLIPVGAAHVRPAERLAKEMKEAGLRVEVYGQNETVGYKIRRAEKQKAPYMIVMGDKEVGAHGHASKLPVRSRGQKKIKEMLVAKFIAKVKEEIEKRK